MAPAPTYRLLAELELAFDRLIESTEALLEAYAASPSEAWAFQAEASTEWLRRALLDFWYTDGQDGRATRSHVGLIAADDILMARVAEVNATKAEFAKRLARIKAEHPPLLAEAKAVLPFRHPQLHDHLRGSGLARLHLKQCWRAVPVAEAPVARVRLAWYSSGRSIKRLTVREVEKKLLALDSDAPHVRIQLRKLAALPSSEPLAQVQRQAPLMRANLFYCEPLEDGRTRRAMNVALPLFLPAPRGRLPDHNQPPAAPPQSRTRARRSDEKLEDTPYLPSLRIYRYR
ncbi:DNA replication terminus site-binding protein [Halomonas sp. MCCC 1A11057]|uniref:DNA replication terminus site-binding protein n=1 Tax=Halomonas sp. MCCC 1A11057 TaxID=2733482 RepID=UPI001F296E43|nr:DNA replication terminus site-binding protein [Halomonas sp. MCCC 1A11057]MCE8031527.1 DNA replication terminus site-binding protein [Halomonas sp. MCCC 1A11057]